MATRRSSSLHLATVALPSSHASVLYRASSIRRQHFQNTSQANLGLIQTLAHCCRDLDRHIETLLGLFDRSKLSFQSTASATQGQALNVNHLLQAEH
tara:strand:- start:1874 stop:2164 length:291 start_codon:yes stop_codon:yes gene_type:complete